MNKLNKYCQGTIVLNLMKEIDDDVSLEDVRNQLFDMGIDRVKLEFMDYNDRKHKFCSKDCSLVDWELSWNEITSDDC